MIILSLDYGIYTTDNFSKYKYMEGMNTIFVISMNRKIRNDVSSSDQNFVNTLHIV